VLRVDSESGGLGTREGNRKTVEKKRREEEISERIDFGDDGERRRGRGRRGRRPGRVEETGRPGQTKRSA
jgi:hypothetical protein